MRFLSSVMVIVCAASIGLVSAGYVLDGIGLDTRNLESARLSVGVRPQEPIDKIARLPRFLAVIGTLAMGLHLFRHYAKGDVFSVSATRAFAWMSHLFLTAVLLWMLDGVVIATLRGLSGRPIDITTTLGSSDFALLAIALALQIVARIHAIAARNAAELDLIL